jgi:hypothetical protein
LATGFPALPFTGATSSDSSEEDYTTGFFLMGTTAFWMGDLALTTFLGCSSLSSSEEVSGLATGFLVGTTAF